MRYVTFSFKDDNTPRLGVIDAAEIVDLQSLSAPTGFGPLPGTLIDLIRLGPAQWTRVADMLRTELPRHDGARHGFDEILADYPYLEREDLVQALRYAAWRSQEREIALSAT